MLLNDLVPGDYWIVLTSGRVENSPSAGHGAGYSWETVNVYMIVKAGIEALEAEECVERLALLKKNAIPYKLAKLTVP